MIKDTSGAVQYVVSIGLDVTELKQAEKALRLSEERFRAFMDNSPDALSLKDREGRYLLGNRQFEKLTGLSSAKLQGRTVEEVFPGDKDLHAELREHERKVFESARVIRRERQGRYPDGSLRHFSVTKFPVFDADGQVMAIGTTNHDVTELKRAEDQLRQSQKMEVVGQLTGGVAHDFNNLLGAVIGNLELAGESLGGSTRATPFVRNAMRAAARGAALTQRLLAFSRKQPLRPEPVDANRLARGMSDLLRRSLGETIDIEIVGDAGLWQCLVDPGQLENVLLNLAINARDSMPTGGMLTIEASNARLSEDYAATLDDVEPGQYVLVEISDTGCGMPADVVEHAFEPFFTTKEVGKGTGLGLSMVYGFVKQSGGHVTIYSEVGEGTTIKLYLPRYYGGDDAASERGATEDIPLARGETVLVVEDDSDVRALIRELLQSLGYAVLEASSAQAAFDVLTDAPCVDLLLTDIVLPGGVNGRQLAEELTRQRPELAVLYTSGYSESAVIHHGRLDPGIELLQKPFLKADLARAVRKALEAVADRSGG